MAAREPAPTSWWVMVGFAVAIGLIAGFGAVVFRAMIAAIHDLGFHGQLSVSYDANLHSAPSPWGPGIILVPVLGAVVVAYLVKTFAPEAKGHGVPEVMDAVYYKRGEIRGVVALIKSLASALSIGSGASVGREGPIIQIGSALGSAFSRRSGSRPGRRSPYCRRARAPASRPPSTRRSAAYCSQSRSFCPKSPTAPSFPWSSRLARPRCSGAS